MIARRSVRWLMLAFCAALCGGCGFLSTEEDEGVCTGTLDGAPVELQMRAGRSSYRVDGLTDDALLTLHYADGPDRTVEVDVGRIERFALFGVVLDEVPLFAGRPEWVLGWEERALAPTDGTLRLFLTEYDVEGTFTYELGGEDRLTCTFSLSRPEPTSGSSDSDWD